MNYRTYAKCFRLVYKRLGIIISSLLAVFGIFSLRNSRIILDHTIFKWFECQRYIEEGLVRLLTFFTLLVLSYALGLFRKYRLNKDHHVLNGLFTAYPIVAVSISVFFVASFMNYTICNTVMWDDLFGLLFKMMMIGLFEEFLFRGMIQNILLMKFSKINWIIAVFLQAVIFGLAHLGNSTEGIDKYVQVTYSILAGFFFGLAYYRTRSLISSIILHGVYDFAINISSCYSTYGSNFQRVNGLNIYSLAIATLLCILFFLLKLYARVNARIYSLREVELELGLTSIKTE